MFNSTNFQSSQNFNINKFQSGVANSQDSYKDKLVSGDSGKQQAHHKDATTRAAKGNARIAQSHSVQDTAEELKARKNGLPNLGSG